MKNILYKLIRMMTAFAWQKEIHTLKKYELALIEITTLSKRNSLNKAKIIAKIYLS